MPQSWPSDNQSLCFFSDSHLCSVCCHRTSFNYDSRRSVALLLRYWTIHSTPGLPKSIHDGTALLTFGTSPKPADWMVSNPWLVQQANPSETKNSATKCSRGISPVPDLSFQVPVQRLSAFSFQFSVFPLQVSSRYLPYPSILLTLWPLTSDSAPAVPRVSPQQFFF